MFDYLIIGGGIVGLATARELALRTGGKIALVEKETRVAAHQSGRNSGVIHSGIYYKPGTLKAQLAVRGNRAMVAFCRERSIPVDVCGKLIVATEREEVPRLDALAERARENGIEAEWLEASAIRGVEPHAGGLAALRIRSAAITDYRAVCAALAQDIRAAGGEIRLGAGVETIERNASAKRVRLAGGTVLDARFVVACAGLQSDRLARLDGLDPGVRIVPFRGEYWEIVRERRSLVRALIYPVPNPDFPFLGVHLTRMIDGSVHAGPNAVLALAREGYRKSDVSFRDLASTLSWPGFWKMAAKNLGEGLAEARRSLSKPRFVASARRLVPGLRERDLLPAESGIRAQALCRDGSLADDFLFLPGERSLHVLNAPSPAATASLEIAKRIADEIATPSS
jgi:L-2-hydroxyglutarate oxidase